MKEKMILDMALGDGYITKQKSVNGNCSLVLKHSTKQIDYLLYKKSLLESEGFVCTLDSYIDPKGYGVIGLRTSKKELITRVRKFLYPNNKKTISLELMNQFDARSLAILFQDDGSRELAKFHRSGKRKYKVNPYINSFIICMHNFTINEISLLKDKLLSWNIESRIGSRNGHVILISKKESKIRFVELIKPFICESMKYKIDYSVSYHGIFNDLKTVVAIS